MKQGAGPMGSLLQSEDVEDMHVRKLVFDLSGDLEAAGTRFLADLLG